MAESEFDELRDNVAGDLKKLYTDAGVAEADARSKVHALLKDADDPEALEKARADAQKDANELRVAAAVEEGKAKVELRKGIKAVESETDKIFHHWSKEGVSDDHETRLGVKSAEELAERRNLK